MCAYRGRARPPAAIARFSCADRLVERPHQRLAEGGDDLQAAGEDLPRGVVVPGLQLGLHRLHDVAAVAGPAVIQLALGDLGELRRRLRLLPRGNRAVPDHVAEHVIPARDQRLIARRVRGRVKEAGFVDHGREHGRLRDIELDGGLAEVRLRRRADAVGVVAEEDRVEVLGEDPVLGLRLCESLIATKISLTLRLSVCCGPDGGVVVPGELLGDRRSALELAAGEVLVRRPQDAGRGDAALGVEMPVLRRDRPPA